MQRELSHAKISVHTGDLPVQALNDAERAGIVAWDIETSGLDWKSDKIGTCQIFIPESHVHIVQITKAPHPNLEQLLSNPDVCKIFHHAPFDVRFMAYQWGTRAQNIMCTKIASKILEPDSSDHSLKYILQKNLGIVIDKKLQVSNWLADNLSEEQFMYAAKDVVFLPILLKVLQEKLMKCQRWPLAQASFAYIPARVELEILGAGDVFKY